MLSELLRVGQTEQGVSYTDENAFTAEESCRGFSVLIRCERFGRVKRGSNARCQMAENAAVQQSSLDPKVPDCIKQANDQMLSCWHTSGLEMVVRFEDILEMYGCYVRVVQWRGLSVSVVAIFRQFSAVISGNWRGNHGKTLPLLRLLQRLYTNNGPAGEESRLFESFSRVVRAWVEVSSDSSIYRGRPQAI